MLILLGGKCRMDRIFSQVELRLEVGQRLPTCPGVRKPKNG